MKNPPQFDQLYSILEKQIATTQTLLDILVAENAALVANDHDAINQIAISKHKEILNLENMDNRRDTLLRTSGFTADSGGIENYIASLDNNTSSLLQNKQSELRSLGKKCQRQNNINGNIINASYHATQRALSILHGIQPENSSQYGPGGTTTPNIPTRNLAKV